MLMSSTRLPRSTIGEEIRNENVTPSGRPALVKPMNSGIEEQEQNGVYYYDRGEKFDMGRVKAIFQMKAEGYEQ